MMATIGPKAGWINVLDNLNQVFIQGMLMIFLYFLNHLNWLSRFENICPPNISVTVEQENVNINVTVEQENVGSLSFLDA